VNFLLKLPSFLSNKQKSWKNYAQFL